MSTELDNSKSYSKGTAMYNLTNAAISLEAVREVLTHGGRREEARTLKGLEIHSPEGAREALVALQSITPTAVDGEALEWAMTVCREAAYNTAA